MKKCALLGMAMLAMPATAHAAPGLAGEVYGATVEEGELELEARYGTLAGGPEDGEDKLVLEAAYGISDKLRIGIFGELEKEPGEVRKFEAVAIEAIYELGSAGAVDFALYGEYEIKFDGADELELKLLMQHRSGPLDVRFNLIAEKELESGHPLELGYAASVDVETIGEVRFGVQAFGELGSLEDFLPRAEHFFGPVAKFEIEGIGPEIEFELGYLFALGSAKDETDGQFRLLVGIEF